MAVPAETLRTFDDATLKESVEDVIYDTSPEDTPWLSIAAQVTADNHTHQWQVDKLDTPSADNKNLEGKEFDGTPANLVTRLDNRTQISTKEPVVSGTDEALGGYGRGRQMAYQEVRKGLALKTDIEMSMFRNGIKITSADGVEGQSGGIETYLVSNVQGGATAVEATGNGVDVRTPGTPRDFDETLFETALEQGFDLGANPDMCFLNAKKKGISNNFSGAADEKNLAVEGERIINVVNFYASDFSNKLIGMIPSRHVNTASVIGIDSAFTGVAFIPGRNMISEPIAKSGDNEKKMLLAEWTLVTRNEEAHFGIYDLN